MDEIICKECEEPVVKMGTQYYCQLTRCGRFSLPCPQVANGVAVTEDEYQEIAQHEGEQREARAAE